MGYIEYHKFDKERDFHLEVMDGNETIALIHADRDPAVPLPPVFYNFSEMRKYVVRVRTKQLRGIKIWKRRICPKQIALCSVGIGWIIDYALGQNDPEDKVFSPQPHTVGLTHVCGQEIE